MSVKPPVIALVGRPNVGKSTIFNRLLRKTLAIAHDTPGVTRDRVMGEARIGKARCTLVDTGGMVFVPGTGPEASRDFDVEILEQARRAVDECQAALLVVDGRAGLTPLDEQAAGLVRKGDKPVLLVVNKVDGSELEAEATADFHALGFEMLPVSAAHGWRLDELRARVEALALEHGGDAETLDAAEAADAAARAEAGADGPLRIAMLGRPNAGKSSLVNALVGEHRLIVSDVAGTTRDAVDVGFEQGGRQYVFVDTAGVRRRSNIRERLEQFSVARALKSSQRADVSVLVVAADEGLTRQDKRLLEYLVKERTPFLLVVNKVDLPTRDDLKLRKGEVEREMRIAQHVPVLYTSALTGAGVNKVLAQARDIRRECALRVGTGELNRVFRQAIEAHQPPMVKGQKGRRLKLYYLTQADEPVPTFVCFVNDAVLVKPSYAKYLENQLRKLLGVEKAPVHVVFRSSHTPKG
ncbi:MAG: ribosome biogenesis GTPase Der [Desulfovibrionaceae bacterium]